MALDTRELFARLIQCEAGGEGTAGMQAVATVIINRATVDVEGNSPGSITAAMCGRSSRSRDSLCEQQPQLLEIPVYFSVSLPLTFPQTLPFYL